MTTKIYVRTSLILTISLCFIVTFSGAALAVDWSDLIAKRTNGKSISSSAHSFTSTGSHGSWGHQQSGTTSDTTDTTNTASDTSNTVTSDVAGVFNGKDYVRSETSTSSIKYYGNKDGSMTKTTINYYNTQGQLVGTKATYNNDYNSTMERTYEYDSNGKVSKTITIKTSTGLFDGGSGKQSTRVSTTTSTFTYNGTQVTENSTITCTIDGVASTKTYLSGRTVVREEGSDITKGFTSFTLTYSDGTKKTYEKTDGKAKLTYYDKDGNVYDPPKTNITSGSAASWDSTKEIIKSVFAAAKDHNAASESVSWAKKKFGYDYFASN